MSTQIDYDYDLSRVTLRSIGGSDHVIVDEVLACCVLGTTAHLYVHERNTPTLLTFDLSLSTSSINPIKRNLLAKLSAKASFALALSHDLRVSVIKRTIIAHSYTLDIKIDDPMAVARFSESEQNLAIAQPMEVLIYDLNTGSVLHRVQLQFPSRSGQFIPMGIEWSKDDGWVAIDAVMRSEGESRAIFIFVEIASGHQWQVIVPNEFTIAEWADEAPVFFINYVDGEGKTALIDPILKTLSWRD